MTNIEDLTLKDKVLIRKGVESVSEDEDYIRKFPENVMGKVCNIFAEDNRVNVCFEYDKTNYTLMYRPSDLVKTP